MMGGLRLTVMHRVVLIRFETVSELPGGLPSQSSLRHPMNGVELTLSGVPSLHSSIPTPISYLQAGPGIGRVKYRETRLSK